MTVSVLMPWSDDESDRGPIFDWVLARYGALLPGADVVLGDSGHEPFNRGASVNRAAAAARGDVFLIADADTAFVPELIEMAVDLAIREDTWVLPYSTYVNLDAASTEQLLAGSPDVAIEPDRVTADFRLKDAVSGLIVLTRAGFERMGGYDEGFRSWGYEDRAFESAANTLLNPGERILGHCFHLWHTPGERFDQPHILHNRDRAESYRLALGNVDRMRQLVGR